MEETKTSYFTATAAACNIIRRFKYADRKAAFLKGSNTALINGLAVIRQYRAELTDPCLDAERAIAAELARRDRAA